MPTFVTGNPSGNSYEQEFSASLRNYFDGGEPQDLLKKNSPLMKRLETKEKQSSDGGDTLVKAIEYAFGGTAQWFRGHEKFSVTPRPSFTTMELDWMECVASTSWSKREKNKNAGKSKVFDLIKGKIKNVEKELRDLLLKGIHSDGTDNPGKQIQGMHLFCSDSGTNAYAGIDPSVTGGSFWKNRVLSAAAVGMTISAATIRDLIYQAVLPMQKDGSGPDFGYCSDDVFRLLLNATLNPYTEAISKDLAEAGFKGVNIAGVDFVNEGGYYGSSNAGATGGIPTTNYAPTSRIRILTTDYIYFLTHEDGDFEVLDPVRPGDQAAYMQSVYWMGNLACTHRALQCVIKP